MAETLNNPEVLYKPVRKDPLDKNRISTDTVCLWIFGIFFITWMGISIYAISSKAPTNNFIDTPWLQGLVTISNPALTPILVPYQPKNTTYLHAGSVDLNIDSGLWITFFGGLILCAWLLIPRWFAAISILIGIAGLILSNFLFVVHAYYFTISTFNLSYVDHDSWSVILLQIYHVLTTVVKFLFIIFALVFVVRAGIRAMTKIIEKALRALMFFPSLIIVGLLVVVWHVIISIFTVIGLTTDSIILKFIIFLGGTYMCSFVYYYGKTVILHTIGTWHVTKNKNEIQLTTIFRCIYIISRFHLGSIAFGATVILPLCLAIFVALKSKFHRSQKCLNYFIQVVCKLYLIPNIANFALIQSSLLGHNFFQATEKTFYLMGKHSSLSLVLIYIFNGFILLGSLIANLMSVSSIWLYLSNELSSDIFFPYLYPMTFTKYNLNGILLLPILIIAESALHCTLLCHLEDKEENEESGEKLSRIPNTVPEEQ